MSQLASSAATLAERPGPRRAAKSWASLGPVISFVEEYLGEHFTLRDLAMEAEVSPFHFARVFKQATGLTPHQYVISRRVERARRLLAKGGRSIAAIAAETGFASQSHLTEMFRREVGMTPRAYRARFSARE